MLYVFRCSECGQFEVDQRISETTKTHECIHCGQQDCPKVIQPTTVHFKGGDWPGKKPKKIKDPNGTDWQERRQKEKQF